MTGTIKFAVIETDTHRNIGCACNLSNVSKVDKVALVDALARALDMSDEELLVAVFARHTLFDHAEIVKEEA